MEHIVYSEIWTDHTLEDDSYLLRIATPVSKIISGSIQSERKSFLVKLSGIGFAQFDFFGLIKSQVVYQATGLHLLDQGQLPLPSVILVAEPQLVKLSPSRSDVV